MRSLLERVEPELGELEAMYRRAYLHADCMQTQVFARVIITAAILFLLVDFALFREQPIMLTLAITLRATAVISSFIVIVITGRLVSPARFDQIVLAYLLLLAVLQCLNAATRPATYYGTTVFDLTLILSCYLVIPTILTYRMIGALAASAGSLFILFALREPSLLYQTSVPIAIVGIHVLGLFGSTRATTFRRRAFQAVTEARELNEQLRVLAEVDVLTGALNRRKLFELGASEFTRYQRYGHPFSVIIADIDHFKQVNDQHGHRIGDAVLARVAGDLAAAKRGTDSLGRIGGEEFVLLLPQTTRAAAFVVAERVRVTVAAESIAAHTSLVAVTLSAGVTEVTHADSSFEEVLHRADQLLYQAKAAGRNRVVA